MQIKLPIHGYKQDQDPFLVKMNDISEIARQLVVSLTSEMQNCVDDDGQPASEFSTCHGRSWGILRGFVLVLLHHECPKNVVLSLVEQWHPILVRLNESQFFRVAKFLCAYPLARFCRNVPPDAPKECLTFPMSGDFRRWFRARMGKYSRINSHLFMSWFQVKRAALPASNTIIDENLVKHRARMAAPDSSTSAAVSECLNGIAPLLNQIRKKLTKRFITGYPIRTVDGQVLPARRPEDLFAMLKGKASQSAAYNSTRNDGGQAGELAGKIGQKFYQTYNHTLDTWYDPPVTSQGDLNFLPGQPIKETAEFVEPLDNVASDLVSMNDSIGDRSGLTTVLQAVRTDHFASQRFARVVDPRLVSTGLLTNDIDFTTPFFSDNEHNREYFAGSIYFEGAEAEEAIAADQRHAEHSRFHDNSIYRSNHFENEVLYVDGEPCLRARVAVVVEPLKVRTVTAGSAAHYYLSSLFQRPYHDILREMPCFRLIGRKASPTDIMDIQIERPERDDDYGEGSDYEFMGSYLSTPRVWYSADYEASTDLLSRFYSSTVFQETIPFAGVFRLLRPLFRMAFKAHVVTYPKVTLASAVISIEQWETLRSQVKKGSSKAAKAALQRRQDDVKRLVLPKGENLISEKLDENLKLWNGSVLHTFFGDDLSEILYEEPSALPVPLDSLVGYRTRVEEPKYEIRQNRNGSYYRQLVGGVCYLEIYRALPPVLQNNAQLMGSKLSFILLCLCNAGLYLAVRKRTDTRLGIKWTERRMKFWLLMVLINGDDLLTQFTQQEIEDFLEIGKVIGLRMSVGKVYQHERYANINSTSYDCPIVGGTAKCVPYLNTGLFFGQNKVMSRVGGIEELTEEERTFGPAPHVVVMDEVLDGALPGKQADLLKAYLEFHKSVLQRESRGRNLFVARSFGGWGCRAPVGWEFHITPTQQNEIARQYRPDLVPLQYPIKRKRLATDVQDKDIRQWIVVENLNDELPRLRKVKNGKVLPMPPVDPTIDHVRRSLIGL